MRDIVKPAQLYSALQAVLGLPDRCVSFELRAAAGHYGVTVTCERYVSLDAQGIEQLKLVLSEYELLHKSAAQSPRSEEFRVVDFDGWLRERTERAHAEFMTRTSQLPV